MALSYQLFRFVVQPLHLQPILKGLPGDADHVADADRLERTGVGAVNIYAQIYLQAPAE